MTNEIEKATTTEEMYNQLKELASNKTTSSKYEDSHIIETNSLENMVIIPYDVFGYERELDILMENTEKLYGKDVYELTSDYDTIFMEDDGTGNEIVYSMKYTNVLKEVGTKKAGFLGLKKEPLTEGIFTYFLMELVGTDAMYRKRYVRNNTNKVYGLIIRKDELFKSGLFNRVKVYNLKEFLEGSYGRNYVSDLMKEDNVPLHMSLDFKVLTPYEEDHAEDKIPETNYYSVNEEMNQELSSVRDIVAYLDSFEYIDKTTGKYAQIYQYTTPTTLETRIKWHTTVRGELRLSENINLYTELPNVSLTELNNKIDSLGKDVEEDIKDKLLSRFTEEELSDKNLVNLVYNTAMRTKNVLPAHYIAMEQNK